MNFEQRISAFSSLGEILRDSLGGKQTAFTARLNFVIENQQYMNPWFTPGNIRLSLSSLADELTRENLDRWCSGYPEIQDERQPLSVGVIMAGNIPLAGFHDFMTVLITGNRIIAKTSSKDQDLIMFIRDILCSINDNFSQRILITDGVITGFDAVIATGSDNSSRYFEYYFGKYPHIIRKNRNSIAIIDGSETGEELSYLGTDIFSYFGLGCRNVAKIYIPEGYDLNSLSGHWSSYSGLVNHTKYANNYDYYKAIFLVNKEQFLDKGFILLKEHTGLSSPVSVLYYEPYKNIGNVLKIIEQYREKIQCIVGRDQVAFGRSQMPALWDYADGTDTMEFLLKNKLTGNIVK